MVGIRLGHDAATDGQHEAVVRVEHALEAAPLDAPVARLSVQHEELGEAHGGIPLDLPVQLDERPVQRLRERASERRLAGAAQADQRDVGASRRVVAAEFPHQSVEDVLDPVRRQLVQEAAEQAMFGRGLAQQLGERCAQRLSDPAQQHDRHVPVAGLELCEVAFRDMRFVRERLARPAAPFARLAHPPAQAMQELGAVALFACGR